MKRAKFDPDASLADAIPHTAVRKSHNCQAHGCPMAGSLNGWCAYHWGCTGEEIARITRCLRQDHRDLQHVIAECRTLLAADPPTAHDVLVAEFAKAAELLHFAGYSDVRAPGSTGLSGWVYSLEVMLGGFVAAARGVNNGPRRRAAA